MRKIFTFGRKIRNKAKSTLSNLLLKTPLALNSPYLAAMSLAFLTKKENSNGSKYKVLALARSIFMDDVKAMSEFSGQIEFLSTPLPYWQIFFDHFMRGPKYELLEENNYHVTNYCTEGREKYFQFIMKFLPAYKKFSGFKAILTGNFAYMPQQELARACTKLNIPFIVLHKEAVAVSESYENYVNQYKNHKFIGAKVLFYNKQNMEGLLNINMAGLSRDNSSIVGIPRFDNYFLSPDEKPNRKQIVFFSFWPRHSFRYITKDEDKLKKIDERSEQFFKMVMELAKKHPDVSFVVKTKRAKHFVEYVENILNKYFKDGIANFKITNIGDPSEMIHQSLAVIGFSSTTLIEAIVVGKLIVTPDFDDIMAGQPWDYFTNHQKLVHYARDIETLEQLLFEKAHNFQYDREARDDFLNEYISTTAGGASKKAEHAIIETIETYNKLS